MKRYTGRGPGGPPAQGHLFPRSRVRHLPGTWICSCLREEAPIKTPTLWGLESFQFGEPASIQDPTQRHLIRTKDTPITQEIPRILGAVSRKGSTTIQYNKRCSQHCHRLGFDQLWAGNQGPRPTYLFSMVLRGDGHRNGYTKGRSPRNDGDRD